MITVIVILVAALAITGILTYAFHKDENDDDFLLSPPTTYTKEELENIKLAEELYDKDLRPIVAKHAPELNVVEPEFIAKEEKVFSKDAVINAKIPIETKSEFPIDKPKKKRKYYPKKKQ